MNYLNNKRANTAEDLRRMFNLDNLSSDRKAIEKTRNSLTKIESEQNNILKSIIISIGDDLESQSNISLWFFSGTPTLENIPYTDWEEPDEHLGDLYYDKETGYVYLFEKVDEEYTWERKTDNELIQAMALTNAEIDTADNVRKVFFTTPTVPYDNGDWYVKDGDLYICQISKSTEEQYDENDFIIAPKYTDDTKANEVAGNLTIVSGQVTTIIQNLDIIQQTIEDDRYYVDEQGERHLISQSVSQLTQDVNALTGLFQVTGGSNMIKDSQLLLKDSGLWEYERIGSYSFFPSSGKYPSATRNPIEYYYNEPDYIGGYDSTLIGKTISKAKIGICNGKMITSETNITDLVIGNMYTLSYKISNDLNTNVKVKLIGNGNVIYEFNANEELEFEEKVFNFVAQTSNYKLEIQSTSTTDGYSYIYDLILNKGDIKPWEPANGELVSTIIRLSQLGIQVFSSSEEIATLMTSEGFEVVRYSNGSLFEVVTKFTKNGFESNKGSLQQLDINGYDFKTVNYQGYTTLVLYKKEIDE